MIANLFALVEGSYYGRVLNGKPPLIGGESTDSERVSSMKKADKGSPDVLAAAREYRRKGWRVIPIARGGKRPQLPDWPQLRLDIEKLPKFFSKGCGIGILLGAPSGGLVDVDLDTPQAAELARLYLPATHRIHGRESSKRSHYWYIAEPIPGPEKFADIDGTCLVELRSTGQQTVVPPSIHLSGEPIRWECEGEPAAVSGEELRSAVARLAACVLLARHWPERGSRHDAALALGGMLLRGGWPEEPAMRFVATVARAAGDEEYRSRAAGVGTTAQRLAADGPATGAPTLASFVGNKAVRRVREWLRFGSSISVPAAESRLREHLTDLGNAKRLVARHGRDLRYCHEWRKWLAWGGTRWAADKTGEVLRRAKDTVQQIYAEASKVDDAD